MFISQIAFTRQKDFGKEQRELKWAHAQRTLHGLEVPDTKMFNDRTNFTELNHMAEEAKRRAEITRSATKLNIFTLAMTLLDCSQRSSISQFLDCIMDVIITSVYSV